MTANGVHGFYHTSRASFRHLIFRAVLQRGPISRQQLARLLQIRYVTLQKLLDELLTENILQESGNVIVRRGRAPIYLKVNPEGGRVVGVALEPTEVSAVLFGLDMTEIDSCRVTINSQDSAEAIRQAVVRAVRQLLKSASGVGRKVWGIGYGEYGTMDTRRGVTIRSAHHPQWREIPVREFLEQEFGVPVRVDLTERCELRSERIWGKDREARTTLFLDVEEGIGLAVFSDGEILSGANGFAGEVGHIQMVPEGEVCLCGGRGCLETVAGTQAIVEHVRKGIRRGIRTDLAGKPLETLTIEDVVAAASRGDNFRTHILNSALGYLGAAVGILINLYNPDAICFSGRLFRKDGARLLETLQREANPRTLREFRDGIRWSLSEIQNAAAKGAAAHVFDDLLEPPAFVLRPEASTAAASGASR